jgi:peptide/nickel transport system substrate-binding protein
MNLAVNQVALVEDYYDGHADLMGYPFYNTPAYSDFYMPLEEMPANVQELFQYKPEKAKQLLTEAGYPDGFTTTISCRTTDVDLLSVIREYLLAVDIDMQINPMEQSVFQAMDRARGQEEMIMKATKSYLFPFRMLEVRQESVDCASFFESSVTREAYNEILGCVGKDDARIASLLRSITPYILEQSWGIWLPVPHNFILWQPWVQNFHGEVNIGYWSPGITSKYIWIDESRKTSLGY